MGNLAGGGVNVGIPRAAGQCSQCCKGGTARPGSPNGAASVMTRLPAIPCRRRDGTQATDPSTLVCEITGQGGVAASAKGRTRDSGIAVAVAPGAGNVWPTMERRCRARPNAVLLVQLARTMMLPQSAPSAPGPDRRRLPPLPASPAVLPASTV